MVNRIINFNALAYTSLGLIILLAIVALLPTISNRVSAAPLTTTAGVAITANSMATVAISVDEQVTIDITPTSSRNGDFMSGVSNVHVSTNNTSGYSLYMSAVNETGNLEPITTNADSKAITNLSVDTLGTNFTGNTWGYNLSRVTSANTISSNEGRSVEENVGGESAGRASSSSAATSLTYSAVPTNATTAIYTTDSANLENSDDYHLTFGVNIDNTLPAGTYTNSVLVSAVANPIAISELSQLTYMQDMTSSICTNTMEHATKQLVDTRDGKKYWVAKLKDGNCWMVQNLALDLSTDNTLTSSDTDLEFVPKNEDGSEYTFTPTTNTNSITLMGTAIGDDENPLNQYSWNLGEVVLSTPLNTQACGTQTPPIKNLGVTCGDVGFIDVSDAYWQPTYRSVDGQITIDNTTKSYDAHYLIGNYYQYNAVVAGMGDATSINNYNIESSICPKGWKLPGSGKNSSGQPLTDNSVPNLYDLLLKYDYPSSEEYIFDSYKNAYTPLKHIVNQNELATEPFYFVRSGQVNTHNGRTVWAGERALYWSSTVATSGAAYNFLITAYGAYPALTSDRTHAQPIRCIAR